jgi:hypothetical protein
VGAARIKNNYGMGFQVSAQSSQVSAAALPGYAV